MRRGVCGIKMRQRRRESMANNDSSSSKLHRRESYLATLQMKPVTLPGLPEAHAEVLCLLYLSDDVFSLPLFNLNSLRMCAGAVPLPFVFGVASVCSLGYHFQVVSPRTRLYSRLQPTHVLKGGIAAMPSFPLPPSLKLYCSCACWQHLPKL
jgi:hypothetical protein